jgi:RNA polymerase sigma-70 factor, ECF subfamily
MKKDAPDRPGKSDSSGQDAGLDIVHSLARSAALIELLYERSQAGRWGLSRDRFACVLERSAKKLLAAGTVTSQKLEEYLVALHLEDLALACACAEGYEAAWEHFFSGYRPYLRAAAAAILHCNVDSPEACNLADSLFADLYGLVDTKGPERSLFRYFHGRSSLKTWLRAVLAQRRIDSIRASRRFEELGEEDAPGGQPRTAPGPPVQLTDPHRQRYLALFSRALQAALERLEPSEQERLRLYYNEEKTLAEIGRLLGEHESSVSRHLDRVRSDLRSQVEEILRRGLLAANGSAAQPGLSDAEITLCFEYSAEDTPIDLEKLLPRPKPQGPLRGKQPS